MIGYICLAVTLVAAIAVAITANGRRLYRLNLEASLVAHGLMYECRCNIDIHRPNLLKSICLGHGTEPFKRGFWLWQKDYRPVVIVDNWEEEDVDFIHDSFVNAVDKYKSTRNQRMPLRYTPVLRFRVEGESRHE
jgi:hypothetical protein